MFTFSVFNQKYPFWVISVQKIEIFSLRWNLVPRLIWIWRFQELISLLLFSTGNILFAQIHCKNSRLSVVTFTGLDCKCAFWENLVQKIEVVSLSWNVEHRICWICRIQWWCSFFTIFEWSYRFWRIHS